MCVKPLLDILLQLDACFDQICSHMDHFQTIKYLIRGLTMHSSDFRYVTKKCNFLALHCNSRLKFIFISDPQLVGQYQLLQGKTCNYTIRSIAVEHVENLPLRHIPLRHKNYFAYNS